MPAAEVLILGCGYTGSRVARLLHRGGLFVVATSRHEESLRSLPVSATTFNIDAPDAVASLDRWVSPTTLVLHSIPTSAHPDATERILPVLQNAGKVVYLSTTGVYGAQTVVDEHTPPAPETDRERARANTDASILKLRNALVLRPAAIYGPHRGIHASMRVGAYKLSNDQNRYVSRIHVDDLAAHCVEGLTSDLSGAWPVGDEEPSTTEEIAAFCAHLLGIPLPPRVDAAQLSETRRGNRRVDGSGIRRALGIKLQFPSYRVGIPACIAAEALERDN